MIYGCKLKQILRPFQKLLRNFHTPVGFQFSRPNALILTTKVTLVLTELITI